MMCAYYSAYFLVVHNISALFFHDFCLAFIFLFFARVHNPELRWMKTSSRDIPSITRVTITSEDILTCGLCSKVFVTLDELSAHERAHADAADDDDESQRDQDPQHHQLDQRQTTFTCERCNKNFTSKQRLSAHIGNNCTDASNPGSVDRHCPYCGKEFRSVATLENHKRVHTREKPFTCEMCSKAFRTKGNLLEHKRVHSNTLWLMKNDQKPLMDGGGGGFGDGGAAAGAGLGAGVGGAGAGAGVGTGTGTSGGADQRFQCTYCAKPFRTYTALLNHERVHTRDKPFECTVCGKCFRTKSNLTEHMKGCHDVDYMSYNSSEVQVFTFKTQPTVAITNVEPTGLS